MHRCSENSPLLSDCSGTNPGLVFLSYWVLQERKTNFGITLNPQNSSFVIDTILVEFPNAWLPQEKSSNDIGKAKSRNF